MTLQNHFLSIFSLDLEVERVEIQHKLEGIQCWGSLRTNLLAFQVTMERLSKAIRKLKNGKGSPDGCTAELFRNLPTAAMQNLCSFLSHVFYTLVIPESWTVVGATLIPKVVGAESLSKFRAIACLRCVGSFLAISGCRHYLLYGTTVFNVVLYRELMQPTVFT